MFYVSTKENFVDTLKAMRKESKNVYHKEWEGEKREREKKTSTKYKRKKWERKRNKIPTRYIKTTKWQ